MHDELNNSGLLILCLSFGISMSFRHGRGKINRILSGVEIKFYDFMGIGSTASLWLAGLAEF